MATVEIVDYRAAWPEDFRALAGTLRGALGPLAARIDHIGSTSVPGLAAKDVIDIQVTVRADDDLQRVAERMRDAEGWEINDYNSDHVVYGIEAHERYWVKRLIHPPRDQRPANVHVRVWGRPNQRYALLFRDYLRKHPLTVAAYAEAKRRLAAALRDDRALYAETKDPIVDLIYLPAEEWADRTAWAQGPSDA